MSFLDDYKRNWSVRECFEAMHSECIEVPLTMDNITRQSYNNFKKHLTPWQIMELRSLLQREDEHYEKRVAWTTSSPYDLRDLYDEKNEIFEEAEALGIKWRHHFFTNRQYLCEQIKICNKGLEEGWEPMYKKDPRIALCFFEKKLLQLADEGQAPTKKKARIM